MNIVKFKNGKYGIRKEYKIGKNSVFSFVDLEALFSDNCKLHWTNRTRDPKLARIGCDDIDTCKTALELLNDIDDMGKIIE